MRRYLKRLKEYLRWGTVNGMGDFRFELGPITAEEAMLNWESRGIPLPRACNNPDLLRRYTLGKMWRDWHLSEWRKGVLEGSLILVELKNSMSPKDYAALRGSIYKQFLLNMAKAPPMAQECPGDVGRRQRPENMPTPPGIANLGPKSAYKEPQGRRK